MKTLITGASGFLGTALSQKLAAAGHQAVALKRRTDDADSGAATWNVETGEIDGESLEGADAIVHLAGENIGSGRWTAAKKKRMYESRVDATKNLCEHLASLEHRPATLVAASAVGYYGNRSDEVLTEESAAGTGYLAELCRDWEQATKPASDAGMRVVNVRTGVVLGRGGPLEKMLLPFKLGAGGIIGSGQQYFSWIEKDDMISVLEFALTNDSVVGPLNAVAPQAVTNREFTKTFGKVLRRPTILPMPAFLARLAFGEMADEAILASTRATPAALEQHGFEFTHPELEGALRHALTT